MKEKTEKSWRIVVEEPRRWFVGDWIDGGWTLESRARISEPLIRKAFVNLPKRIIPPW